MDNTDTEAGRIVSLVDGIAAVLAGANVAEGDAALSLAVALSICARAPGGTTTRYQVLEGFTRMVSELIQREDLVDWIKASITDVSRARRA